MSTLILAHPFLLFSCRSSLSDDYERFILSFPPTFFFFRLDGQFVKQAICGNAETNSPARQQPAGEDIMMKRLNT